MFILQSYAFSRVFLVFEIRKNLDLRKILITPKIFLNRDFTVLANMATSGGQFSCPMGIGDHVNGSYLE